jgi:hypothetical protein
MKSPCCLCVCLSSYQLLNESVDFYGIQEGGHVTEGDLDVISPQLQPVIVLPAPFCLAQQWVGTVQHSWVSMVTSHIIFS